MLKHQARQAVSDFLDNILDNDIVLASCRERGICASHTSLYDLEGRCIYVHQPFANRWKLPTSLLVAMQQAEHLLTLQDLTYVTYEDFTTENTPCKTLSITTLSEEQNP